MQIRNYKKNSLAQGTIEYLVIIAVVVVLALVVVGLVVGIFDSPSQQISSSGNELGLSSQSIGITESLIEPNDGNFVVRLVNNSGDNITVSNVSVGDNNVNFSEELAQGGERFFIIDTDDVCSVGKVVSEGVVVTYVTRDGLTKKEEYPVKVMFSCTPYVINQANLADQCPQTCAGGSQSLSPASTTVNAGCYSATTLNVVDTDLNSNSILSGVTIFGIEGSVEAGGGEPELIWSNPFSEYHSFKDALDTCSILSSQDGNNWRLPTKTDMERAMSEGLSWANYNGIYEPAENLWTSTTVTGNESLAYHLNYNGEIYYDSKDGATFGGGVRCVRDAS